jgi:hypothetical protein
MTSFHLLAYNKPLQLVYHVPLAEVLPGPQLIFPSKIWFLELIWIFSNRNHLKINMSHNLNPILTQKNLLNPVHQDLSNNTKGTFEFHRDFQLQFNWIFNERIVQYSTTFAPQVQTPWNQAHAPVLIESFPMTPRTQSKKSQFGGFYN